MSDGLAVAGGHELQPLDDATLLEWNPQTYVITRTSEHADAWAKFADRALHVRALLPLTKIVLRHQMSRDRQPDDQRSSRYSAKEIADLLFQYAIPGTLLMPDNEAGSDKDNPNVFAHTVDVWTELVRIASPKGIALAIGCKSSGTPDYPQYRFYGKLLAAMRDGAREYGVVHWLYTNAYYDPTKPGHPDFGDFWDDHLLRHQREIRRVAALEKLPMPPMMLGELGIAWDYQPEEGYGMRMNDVEFATDLTGRIAARVGVPFDIFSIGDGIYDSRWRYFNVNRPGFWKVFLPAVPRVPSDTNRKLEADYLEACAEESETDKTSEPGPAGQTLPEPGDPRWREGVAHPRNVYVNVRSEPSTRGGEATIIGRLDEGQRCSYVDQVRAGAGNDWMPVYGINTAITGWVSVSHAGITPYESSLTVTLPDEPDMRAGLHAVFEQLERGTRA